MNEEQRNMNEQAKPFKPLQPTKDYSAYFQAPSLKDAKKRGKEEVAYEQFSINAQFKGMGNGRKFMIQTFGCQMNVHDTEVMAGIFESLGYEATEDVNEANVILLNTCAIRENAENRVFGELGHLKPLKTKNPDLLLGVCGCMSQEEAVVNKILKTYDQVDIIFGTHNIHKLPEILNEAYMSKEMVIDVWSKEGDVIENMPKVRNGGTKAWVNIMYGCDKFCTYCIVPYTRGKERSRLPQDIIQEVRELAAQGYQEITLLGQNVNAYGKLSEVKEVSLKIKKPWYATNIAYFIYFIVLIIIAYFVIDYVNILNKLVKQRTEELNQKMKENKNMYDKLLKCEKVRNQK